MTVHLSRKWRSRNFDELVGQELSIRLLKNSLFKGSFFPAYLFSGLRGSGKTSMGRIFAAAVNCAALDSFRHDPRTVVLPCNNCASCAALVAGQHPDFIEIDAASYTGVDNMRLIIENASLLPTLAARKIYLIDEAHMLSKAAFNAALKVLEEPPAHVIFILATTDPEKIIETVKSRCFQVFFDPIPKHVLVKHVQNIADVENIPYDQEGLTLIAQQAGGSARDALTTLERIALAQGDVTAGAVKAALGLVEESLIESLMSIILAQDTSGLMRFVKESLLLQHNPMMIWQMLTRALVKRLHRVTQSEEYDRLLALLRQSYEMESLLARTAMKAELVEYMLIRMSRCFIKGDAPIIEQSASSGPTMRQVPERVSSQVALPKKTGVSPEWDAFIELIKTKVEPLVLTLFTSARVEYMPDRGVCLVKCLKEHELFKEWLDRSLAIWKPLLGQAFGASVEPVVSFVVIQENRHVDRPVSPGIKTIVQVNDKKNTSSIHSSDTVTQALKIFPGTIQELP